MCGIVAAYAPGGGLDPALVRRAVAGLRHRGPDAEALWMSDDRRVALGHTRLSIIDLAGGGQPIANEDGRMRIVVNGEFYEHDAALIRLEAAGHRLRTRSDSEIALHLYEDCELAALDELRGEFAFVLWDGVRHRLIAARDRFGIKPLFFAVTRAGTLLLASEAKALFALGVEARWDREAFVQQALIGLLPRQTLFAGVQQVPAGHVLIADGPDLALRPYWDLDYPRAGEIAPRRDEEHVERVRDALDEAVRVRLRADVAVSCFLSGGIDSSAVLGFAARHRPCGEPPRAFTVTFGQAGYDEGGVARETAAAAGAVYEEIPIDAAALADHLGDALWHAEMLGVNAHGVARYLQCRAVRAAGYKVALSGEGADELFGGYAHARQEIERTATAHAGSNPEALAGVRRLLGFVPAWLSKLAVSRSPFHLVLAPDAIVDDPYARLVGAFDIPGQLAGREPLAQSLYLWTRSILPNYILFAERLEMAHAVEVRVPFLDHRLFEVARELPADLLVRGRQEKYVLREAARPVLTPRVYGRPKQPFTAPQAAVANGGPMHDLLQDTLRGPLLASLPFFDRAGTLHLLDRLPRLDDGRRLALDPALLMVLGACLLQDRLRLSV